MVAKRATKVGENGRISSGFGESASVKVVINCETKVELMDKVNCELYRFIVELKLRARFAHQCRRMDDNRPCSRSTSSTSTSVVKDVKGTGDPEGIIDAVGRRQSA